MLDQLNPEEVVVGNTYRVCIEDCCVNGEFVSKLVECNNEDMVYRFENGVSLSGWGVILHEVDGDKDVS